MTMNDKNDTDDWIDTLLRDVRRSETRDADAPPALVARVTADALAKQPPPAVRAAPRPGAASIAEFLGGWFGLGGLATAAVTGLALGLSAPAWLQDAPWIGGQLYQTEMQQAVPDFTTFGWEYDDG